MHLASCSNAQGGACVQEGREHTPCQLQGHRQITTRLSLCRPGPGWNRLWFPQLWFPQPRLRRAVSLPRALTLSPLYNNGCRFLQAIEVTVLRIETTRKRRQQWEEKSCLGQGTKTRRDVPPHSIAQPTHSKAGSCSCPRAQTPPWAPHAPALPRVQWYLGQLEWRCSSAGLASGTRGC